MDTQSCAADTRSGSRALQRELSDAGRYHKGLLGSASREFVASLDLGDIALPSRARGDRIAHWQAREPGFATCFECSAGSEPLLVFLGTKEPLIGDRSVQRSPSCKCRMSIRSKQSLKNLLRHGNTNITSGKNRKLA